MKKNEIAKKIFENIEPLFEEKIGQISWKITKMNMI